MDYINSEFAEKACLRLFVTQDDRFTSRNTYKGIVYILHQFDQCYKLRNNAVLIHSGKVAFKLFCLNNKRDFLESEKINEVNLPVSDYEQFVSLIVLQYMLLKEAFCYLETDRKTSICLKNTRTYTAENEII